MSNPTPSGDEPNDPSLKTARVERLEQVSPRLLRVQLVGESLTGLTIAPGDKVKLHIGEGRMRSYTPTRHDADAGRMHVVVHLHGSGPASAWAGALKEGARVGLAGPSKSLDGKAPPSLPWAAFYGDETTLALAEAILSDLPVATPESGAIETEREDLAAVDSLPIEGVARTSLHGEALASHLMQTELPASPGIVWLSGEAGSVLVLRTGLLKRGLSRDQLRIKPYWSLKGKAHRKLLERTVFGV